MPSPQVCVVLRLRILNLERFILVVFNWTAASCWDEDWTTCEASWPRRLSPTMEKRQHQRSSHLLPQTRPPASLPSNPQTHLPVHPPANQQENPQLIQMNPQVNLPTNPPIYPQTYLQTNLPKHLRQVPMNQQTNLQTNPQRHLH